ncbi:hypothetical protein ED208_08730 [Stagnimonas aquatica]|uniref:Outer membrane protein assembly factor BamE n=1 Tax=Stagnimonas aquatica TaxID=2689987 RepID=A0A3N0VE44_9GAMM|nr:hypothetical protein [Stagnimonas aquatica]ROH91043.1 hypothetical protein ED208_08730 [Stagnimonas aquatica]
MTTTHTAALLALSLSIGLGACSTTASRIGEQQGQFDSYPAEVREKIRAGEIAIGFTPEQVRMALGEPSRVYSRQTAEGEAEVWSYQDRGPALSFGLGGFSGGGTSVGAGVGIGTGGEALEKLRVQFEAGRVSSIETAGKN